MKQRSFHLFALLLGILAVFQTDVSLADLNHYIPAPDARQPDPCPPDDDNDCGGTPDSSAGEGDQGCESNKAGDPFDLHSGEFELTKTYLNQPGGSMKFRLRLHYSSYLNVHTTVGYGWTHNYNLRLRETSQGRLVMVDQQGSLIFFNSTGANTYLSDDIWNTEAKFENSIYTVTRKNGKKYTFDSEGRLTSIIDPTGCKHVVTYAATGQTATKHPVTCIPRNSNLTTATTVVRDYRVHKVEEQLANGNSTGRYLEFFYDANTGLIDYVQDQASRKVEITHDANSYGNLKTLAETLDANNTLSSHYTYYMAADNTAYYGFMETFSREGCSDCTTRRNYYYNGGTYSGWVSRQVQGEHGEGEDISVAYAAAGNIHTVTLTHNINIFDQATNNLTNVGSWQEVITYVADSRDQRRVKRRTKKRPQLADANQPAGAGDYYIEYTYYGEDPADQQGVNGAYIGKVKTRRGYNGVITHYTYNANGMVLTETSPVSAGVDHITAYEYDALNNLTKTTISQTNRPEQFVTEYEYYPNSYLLRYEKRKKGNNDYLITEYTYYPSGHASENLLKDTIARHNGTVLSTTRNEYTTSADAPQPVGLLKKSYDVDDPTYTNSYHYTASGYRDQITDAKGNVKEIDFDSTGRIKEVRIKDSVGTIYKQVINTFVGSNLTEVKTGTAAEGYRIVRFTYDSLNRRNSTIRVSTDTDPEVEEIQSTVFYRSDGKRLTTENALGQMVSLDYGDNSFPWVTARHVPWRENGGNTEYATTRYWYDSHGRAYLTQESGGSYTFTEYDSLGRVTRQREAYGTSDERMSEMDYDALGNVVTLRIYGKDGQNADELVGTTYNFYDAIGRKVGVNWNPVTDTKQGDIALPVKVLRDDSNLSITTTDGEGNSTIEITDRFSRTTRIQFADRADHLAARPQDGNDITTVYDVLNNRIQVTDGRGIHRYFKYDALNRLTHTSVETDQDWSAATWWTDPVKVSSEVKTYSAWDEALEAWDSDRVLTTVTYDSFGRMKTSARPGTATMTYRYTKLDQVEFIDYPAQADGGHPATSVQSVYDSKNGFLLKSVTDRAGNTTSYAYTNRFQRSTIQSSLNQANPKFTVFTYDARARIKTSKNEVNDLTTFEYDTLSNITKVFHPDHPYQNDLPNTASSVGVESFQYTVYNQVEEHTGTGTYPVKFAYDLAGNRLSMTDNKAQSGGAMFTNGTKTLWEYDSRNRVSRKYHHHQGPSTWAYYHEYTYNANGALKTRRNGNGTVTSYVYEAARNLLKDIDYPSDTDNHFEYDKARRRTRMEDAGGITEWAYDSLGRLETYTQNNVNQSIHYKYDSWSRIKERRVRPVGTVEGVAGEWLTAYSYDVAGRLLNLTDHHVDATNPFVYKWHDNASLVERITFPSGAKQEKGYDVLGRLKLIEAFNQSNTKLNSFDHHYNSVGQKDEITLVNGNKLKLAYDEKRQLNTAQKVDSSDVPVAGYDFDFDFDAIGNRSQIIANGVTTPYFPNALNQYAGIGGTAQNPTTAPTFDSNGGLLTDDRLTNTWNEENRLKTVADSTTNTRSESLYDGQGRKVQREDYDASTGGNLTKTTRYLYEGWNRIAEYDVAGSTLTLEKSYTWGLDVSNSAQGAGGVGGLLAITDHQPTTPASHYVTYDGNGNVVDLVDTTGAVSTHYEYSPFGKVLVKTGTFADENTYRFSTKPVNLHAGELLYYGYRHYDARHARWMSTDPIEESGGLNLYGFIGNRPIGSVDILGMSERGVLYNVASWIVREGDTSLRGMAEISDVVGSGIGSSRPIHNTLYNLGEVQQHGKIAETASAGAVVVATAPYTATSYGGLLLSGAIAGGGSDFAYQAVGNVTGSQSGYDVRSIATNTVVGGAIGPAAKLLGRAATPLVSRAINKALSGLSPSNRARLLFLYMRLHQKLLNGESTEALERCIQRELADLLPATPKAPNSVNPHTLRFSQSSVNGAEDLTERMVRNGWKGDPIDVVRMSDGGLTTIDNTRVLAASRAGIDVKAVIHNADDALPANFVERFTTKKGGVPTTWGEALQNRIQSQNRAYRTSNPNGSYTTGSRQ